MPVIRLTDNKDKAKWDEYVLSHPDSAPYHLWAWKESVEQAYGHKTYYFIAEKNEQVVGLFPLVHLHIPLLLSELIALPFCDLGNCLADSREVESVLLEQVKDFSKKIKCRKSSLRGNFQESDPSVLDVCLEDTGKVRMLLSLPESSEKLWSSFKSKLRSQIRKAEKNGVKFRWGESNAVDSFYAVYSHNMRDLGSPPHSREWFVSIMQHFGDHAKIGLVEYEGRCIGSGLILSSRNLISIPWASTLREFNRLGPNMLLYWNFLQYSADDGFKSFDFGRSTEGEGTYRFKKQWGAEPVALPWYSLQQGKEQQSEALLQPKSKVRSLIASTWEKFPLPVSEYLGSRLRKYISL